MASNYTATGRSQIDSGGAPVWPRRLTLTFDNGPTPGITERVLDILAASMHKGSTFV